MHAIKIKVFNSNFALFKMISEVDCPVTNDKGAKCAIPVNWNGVLAVRPSNFCGWAKGSTGRHALNSEVTDAIIITSLRVHDNGKLEAQKWILSNQAEVDRLYSQRRCFNI